MAMACFRLFTFGPFLLPDRSLPDLYSFITFLTLARLPAFVFGGISVPRSSVAALIHILARMLLPILCHGFSKG